MEKVTVKNLIEFRRKNDRTRITFANNLKTKNKKFDDGSGGDYWISCLSAIRNTFRFDNVDLLDEKIDLLYEKITVTEPKKVKDQFQKNIEILSNFKEYDLAHLKPSVDITLLKQSKAKALLNINGLPIEAKPCYIYTFSENNKSEEIGGIWFVAKKNGFKKIELGMFADLLYRYLEKHFSGDFFVNTDYCIAVDVFNGQEVSYSDIKNGHIPILIDTTIDDIQKISKW